MLIVFTTYHYHLPHLITKPYLQSTCGGRYLERDVFGVGFFGGKGGRDKVFYFLELPRYGLFAYSFAGRETMRFEGVDVNDFKSTLLFCRLEFLFL